MSDCSNHKKEVAGITDMKVLAEAIGNLHYATLSAFLQELSDKLRIDADNDREAGRHSLAWELRSAANDLMLAKQDVYKAWQISKPFMGSITPQITDDGE